MRKMATRNQLFGKTEQFIVGASFTMGVVYLLGIICEICHLIYGGW